MTEKALIAGINLINSKQDINAEMNELQALCAACDIEVVDSVIQSLPKINTTSYVGKGKLDEILSLIDHYEVSTIVFNDELTPAQIRTIEKKLQITVYDRTFVVLEIFRRRAQTKEAILQVEIATLNYLLPRLVGMREGLSRQRGVGSSFQYGRGGGETKLELDRRQIQTRITQLKKELSQLTHLRSNQRKLRKNNFVPVVSIVGYTNSGKSSLLNTILNYSIEQRKKVFQKDMLFATLETATRKIKLKNHPKFLLTDTVGFVQKLPPQLIEAFKSTLEEITESDLILHVIDASNELYSENIKVTNQVLLEIGVKDIPVLYCFNKMDLIDGYFYIEPEYKDAIRISAKTGDNIEELLTLITDKVFAEYEVCTFLIPFSQGNIIDIITSNNEVISTQHTNDGTILKAKVPPYLKNKYHSYIQK